MSEMAFQPLLHSMALHQIVNGCESVSYLNNMAYAAIIFIEKELC